MRSEKKDKRWVESNRIVESRRYFNWSAKNLSQNSMELIKASHLGINVYIDETYFVYNLLKTVELEFFRGVFSWFHLFTFLKALLTRNYFSQQLEIRNLMILNCDVVKSSFGLHSILFVMGQAVRSLFLVGWMSSSMSVSDTHSKNKFRSCLVAI